MPSLPVHDGRQSKRNFAKTRASLIVNNRRRLPCLVLDSSERGFRIRCGLPLRRGQLVEVILHDDPLNALRCSVVWIGKPGSQRDGEFGLEAV